MPESPEAKRRSLASLGDASEGNAPVDGGSLAGVRFLTVAEVAQVMRLSKMSVYRLIHGGDLEAVRFGRSFRVAEKAVDAYLRDSFYNAG